MEAALLLLIVLGLIALGAATLVAAFTEESPAEQIERHIRRVGEQTRQQVDDLADNYVQDVADILGSRR